MFNETNIKSLGVSGEKLAKAAEIGANILDLEQRLERLEGVLEDDTFDDCADELSVPILFDHDARHSAGKGSIPINSSNINWDTQTYFGRKIDQDSENNIVFLSMIKAWALLGPAVKAQAKVELTKEIAETKDKIAELKAELDSIFGVQHKKQRTTPLECRD